VSASLKTATLDVVGNPGGSVSSTLTGNATVAQGGLEVTPPSYTFVQPNMVGGPRSSDPRINEFGTFTVTNISATGGPTLSNLTLRWVAVQVFAAAPPPEFNTDFPTACGQAALRPGISCTFRVDFGAQAVGPRQMNFLIEAHDVAGLVVASASGHVEGTGTQ
jgi:hypothetical protein